MADKPHRRSLATPPAGGDLPPGTRLIRKYGNRRLYDTRASRYVTLEDLVDVFTGEEDVHVVDAVSGEDLTKRVLAQAILFEEQRRGTQILPVELLRTLLRHRGETTRHAYQKKLARAVSEIARARVRAPGAGPVAAARAKEDEIDDLRRRLRALEKQLQQQR